MDGFRGTLSRARVGVRFAVVVAINATFGFVLSCDALSPNFLSAIGLPTIGPSSAGHVAVVFRNDTQFDAELVQHLRDIGVADELLDDPNLRPLVRFVVRVTFVNGEQLDMVFRDGSTVIDPTFDPTLLPDLTRDQLNNVIVQCDVARVEVIETTLQIFIPVFFEITRVDPGDENTPPFFVRLTRTAPAFELLERDEVDAQGLLLVQRNFDIRDAPAPVFPLCGSAVVMTLSGTLRLPFETNANDVRVPGLFNTNIFELRTSPGRFQMLVSLR